MMVPISDIAFPFLALYAETHFRFFRWFPSLLFAKQPEVVFDAPRRIGPGHNLPVVLIVNDLHRFPCKLSDCAIVVSQEHFGVKRFDFKELALYEQVHSLGSSMRAFIFPLPRNELPEGIVYINACITISHGNRRYTVLNDNLPTSKKSAFTCALVKSQLPGSDFCNYGDLHVHSHFSQSHVEFGPPLQIIDAVAHASGLSFVAITDHSYDLACSTADYLLTDPSKPKWRLFQEEITKNGKFKTLLIPGEEVSCLNGKKEVVHLCGINIHDYLPGSLDGARSGRARQQQLSINETIHRIHKQGGTAFAAHPGSRPGFLSRILLYRGNWSREDLSANEIDGMQLLNSGFSGSWDRGKIAWISLLQNGHKMPLLAGNDAHGDFNRYRAIRVPFLAISDSPERYMGYGKTGIYGCKSSISQLTDAIKNGETFVTTGPFAGISFSPSPADSIVSHQPVSLNAPTIFINAISSPEFGPLRSITCFAGMAGNPVEKIIVSRNLPGFSFTACEKIDLSTLTFKPTYIRAEVSCVKNDNASVAAQGFTSPVYF